MDIAKHAYEVVFYERADPRVKDWLFMTSPIPLAAVITTYLVVIKLLLPAYMKNRKAFELRSVIKWYNVGQIIANAVVTWGLMTSGWTTHYHFGCMLPDYSMNPLAVRMLRFMWWTIVLKLMELAETAFFILRKRDRQASFLHIYHHVSTLIIVWAAVKYVGEPLMFISTAFLKPYLRHSVNVKGALYVLTINDYFRPCYYQMPSGLIDRSVLYKKVYLNSLGSLALWKGGIASFSPMLNNGVHVIMYTYYLLSAEGSPRVKAYLNKYKKWLTVMQMAQFTVMIIYSSQVFLPSCPAPTGIAYLYFPNVVFVYYMFYNFFKNNYSNSSKHSQNGVSKKN